MSYKVRRETLGLSAAGPHAKAIVAIVVRSHIAPLPFGLCCRTTPCLHLKQAGTQSGHTPGTRQIAPARCCRFQPVAVRPANHFQRTAVRRQNIGEVFASLDSYTAVLVISRAQRLRPQAACYIRSDADAPAETREEELDIALHHMQPETVPCLLRMSTRALGPARSSRASLFSGEAEASVVLQCRMQTSMHHFLGRWHIHLASVASEVPRLRRILRQVQLIDASVGLKLGMLQLPVEVMVCHVQSVSSDVQPRSPTAGLCSVVLWHRA